MLVAEVNYDSDVWMVCCCSPYVSVGDVVSDCVCDCCDAPFMIVID